MTIKKILVANRGEIAMRVMRSAREMGIATVSIYSEADKLLPHTAYADEAVHIGGSTASESYLDQDKIIEACKATGADAIHPGYGFLSENASFAAKVRKEGVIFIGPSSESIKVMGDKLMSKRAVKAFNVPLVPGMEEPVVDVAVAKNKAQKIGYPVMIKAGAGGGGKGMRIVNNPDDFESQLERAMSEAKKSFDNDEVFIEKMIHSPKHIEVQILGDQHGNMVHLFERECSIQRRHQKIIEEAPSALLSDNQRMNIGNLAVNVAKSCQYYGAGTVEFIADEALNFYFLEMNTRLQVEHPVTEMITRVDLVKEQIKIAEGKPLSFTQDDLSVSGHSLEVRVYAEDAENNFLPDTGKLKTYQRPQGPGVRVDDGYDEGYDVTVYYDPMIAKLITYGKDRNEAISRMKRAISEYNISGVKTTLPFCQFVLNHPEFVNGTFTTLFVDSHYTPDVIKSEVNDELSEVIAIATSTFMNQRSMDHPKSQKRCVNKWKDRLKY